MGSITGMGTQNPNLYILPTTSIVIEVVKMVRNEISQKVGQEVVVRGRVSVPWNGHRVAWCVENIVVDGEIPVDHSWIQIVDCSEEVCEVGRNVHRGDIVELRAVVGSYVKKGEVVDYNFREVEVN